VPPTVVVDLTERAARFVERYAQWYERYRQGARYLIRPARDHHVAEELCRVWSDDRLARIAILFLTTDHPFAASGSRTIPQLAAMASWADGKLREAGL
jgi:hypothetical protein